MCSYQSYRTADEATKEAQPISAEELRMMKNKIDRLMKLYEVEQEDAAADT